MTLILGIIGLFAPRFLIALLWLASSWFDGIFETRMWPILGFIFLPLTLLWYSAVEKWFLGEWTWWQVGILIIAVLSDLHSDKKVRK